MGKKARKERVEKREDFAVKRSREKRKNALVAAGVFGLIAVIVGYSVYTFMSQPVSTPGTPPGAGVFGDEHEHVSVLVRIFGDKFDFSGPAFQIKNRWIHFEGRDGDTVHRHSSGVTSGYLFETLGIDLTSECFIFPDGREFCNNEDYSLKFYINHEPVPSILNYVGNEGDKILISYGDETLEQLDEQLEELDSQIILK
ncbi:MAG: protein-disulfide isomerase [Thaumarchaeota archaeon]|nr:protein-disulfide isomerase [Nitrososphaerota archaeon]